MPPFPSFLRAGLLYINHGDSPHFFSNEPEAPHFFRGELARISKAISLLQEALSLAKDVRVRQGISQLIVNKEHHLQELREVQQSMYAEAS